MSGETLTFQKQIVCKRCMVIYKMNYIKIVIICLNLCLIQLAWSGLKQSDMAFSDKGFTGEFIYMLKKDICEIMKSFVTSTSISKKKEQSAKIPGMEVVNKDLK